jgi:hypothetical protein
LKKNTSIMAVRILLMSVLLAGCTPMQKTVITESTLPTLKGTWSGWTTFSSFQANSVRTTLEISTDKVPIRGKLILHQLPGIARVIFPIELKDVSADNSVTLYFENAAITNSGTLLGTNGPNFLELTYYAEEKQHRFDGRFYFYGGKGDFTATKD